MILGTSRLRSLSTWIGKFRPRHTSDPIDSGASGENADVVIYTDSDRTERWYAANVRTGNLVKLDGPPADGYVLSLSERDHMMPVDRGTSRRSVSQKMKIEYGEPMRCIGLRKGGSAVYVTPEDRLLVADRLKIIPAMAILKALLASTPDLVKPAVAGFYLGSQDGLRMLSLYKLDARGVLSGVQNVPGVSNIETPILQFAKEREIKLENNVLNARQVCLFEFHELVPLLAAARPYPSEGEFFGIPKSQAGRYAVATATAGLALSASWSIYQWHRTTVLQDAISVQSNAVGALRSSARMLVRTHAALFARGAALDPLTAVAKAQEVYIEEGRVSITMDRSAVTQISVGVPLTNQSGVRVAPTFKSAPQGCTLVNLKTTPTVNLLQTTYECSQYFSLPVALYGSRDLFGARLAKPGVIARSGATKLE